MFTTSTSTTVATTTTTTTRTATSTTATTTSTASSSSTSYGGGRSVISTRKRAGFDLAEFDQLNKKDQLNYLGMPPKTTLVVSERPSLFTGLLETKTKPRVHKKRREAGGGSKQAEASCKTNINIPFHDNVPIEPDDHIPDHGNEDIIKQIDAILAEFDGTLGGRKKKTWVERMDAQDENWEESRDKINSHLLRMEAIPSADKLCMQCGIKTCTVRCLECINSYQCGTCDSDNHKNSKPFHVREDWLQGFFSNTPSGLSVNYKKEEDITCYTTFRQYLPLQIPETCRRCHSEEKLTRIETDSTYIVVTLKGRFELYRQNLLCPKCGEDKDHQLEDLICSGYWPGSIKDTQYVFEIELLRWVDILFKNMPGTSLSAIAQALQSFGPQNLPINRIVLTKALREYRYSMRYMDMKRRFDVMKCPPCTMKQHSAHVDGNFKLYRYKKVERGARVSAHDGIFIVPDDDVKEHMKIVYSPEEVTDNRCGDTVWKAARASCSSKSNQDETGLAVAGCRHALGQKAVNMTRGEVYGYPHFLHTQFMLPKGVKFMWQDVICKYWPWAKKQQEFVQGTTLMKPALSVMHAKAHAWDCQVIWGGRYQEGAGTGTGEEMEQLFSYLSRLNSTTKNMKAAARHDTITEHVFFWNSRKILTMPELLCKRFIDVENSIAKTNQQWEQFWEVEGNMFNRRDIEMWHADIVNMAEGNAPVLEASIAAEFFHVSQRLKETSLLSKYTKASDKNLSYMTGTTMIFSEAKKHASDESMLLDKKAEILQQNPDKTEEELFEAGLKETADAKQHALQQEVEIICYTIEARSKIAMKKEAVSSKQRRKLQQKNAVEKKKLRGLLGIHAEISKIASHPEYVCTIEQADDRKFPWSSGGNLRDATIEIKKAAVDLHMLRQRLAEETTLLKSDMYNFLYFYLDIRGELQHESDLLQQTCRTGELEVNRKGLVFASNEVARAGVMFKKVLQHQWDDVSLDLRMLELENDEDADSDLEDEDDKSEDDTEKDDV